MFTEILIFKKLSPYLQEFLAIVLCMVSKLQKSTAVYKDTDCNFPFPLQKALLYINFHSKTH